MTTDPYKIFVSEIMLQQTQVDRVKPKYVAFIKKFPNWSSLARANLRDVLTAWSGLGYNRRAKFLHRAAQVVITEYSGELPSGYDALRKIPGVGDYTAHAIIAFAFNKKAICIETNIRTVFIHSFFKSGNKIADSLIKELVSSTLPRSNFRDWYYALMDRGASLKKTVPAINARSAQYVRQSPFKGSNREVRGAILKLLTRKETVDLETLKRTYNKNTEEISGIIQNLLKENLIVQVGKRILLP